MAIFDAFNISASGLVSERLRLDTISNNIANINTTRTPQGGPYRRQQVIFQEALNDSFWTPGARATNGGGVRPVGIVEDQSAPIMVYDPSHPDANAQGYVAMPAINIVKEMVDMISATRAYEANVTALNAAKSMAMRALDILT
jgi:flagellar basal-body rod protein FlgC